MRAYVKAAHIAACWAVCWAALSGCDPQQEPIKVISDGYVMQSLSADISRRSIGFTITFANTHVNTAACVDVTACAVASVE